MMEHTSEIHINHRAKEIPIDSDEKVGEAMEKVVSFHKSLPMYEPTAMMLLEGLMAGDHKIRVKDESSRLGLNAFKGLGASYAIHRLKERGILENKTILAATAGNHGMGVAKFGKYFGVPVKIIVPDFVSPERIRLFRSYGAEVEQIEQGYDEAVRTMRKADPEKYVIVSDTGWEGYEEIPVMIREGYYTLFWELHQQLKDEDINDIVLFLQGGVGTFASAGIHVFNHLRSQYHSLQIILTEPASADCMFKSIQAGTSVEITVGITDAHSLACGSPNQVEINNIIAGTYACIRSGEENLEKLLPHIKKQVHGSVTGLFSLYSFLNLNKEDISKLLKKNSDLIFINTERLM